MKGSQCSIEQQRSRASLLNVSLMSLPKREELSLRKVFAFPHASSSGDDAISFSVSDGPLDSALDPLDISLKYSSRSLVVSVLPEPLSPLITIAWHTLSRPMPMNALATIS